MSPHTEASALISSLSNLSSKLFTEHSDKARKEALHLSKALTATLEKPENVAVELAFSSMGLPLSARIAVDLKLFEFIVFHQGPITAAQLALLPGGEELLITRILQSLSASGFVKEVDEQTWGPTPISIAMTNPGTWARVYFYHILHDRSDDKCLEILACVKKAMKPGYSKLLIHEMILPEQEASAFHAMLNLKMIMFNGGMERTGKQWRVLLESVGFEVLKVWKPEEEDADGIFEAVIRE